jgi:cytochrome bd-type quinol oxidase subunit 2
MSVRLSFFSASEPSIKRHTSVFLLLGILLLSALLVPLIAVKYAYDRFSLLASSLGFVVLLAAFGATWLLTRTARQEDSPTALDQRTLLGLVLGLAWLIEISINNLVAPPTPARDVIDNIFWALIALVILVASIAAAYRSGRIRPAIAVGTWTGFVSGVVACGTGLVLIAFGMFLLLRDPTNLGEWSNRGKDVTAPTMASYFAYETLAGAFLHLVVSGVAMGFLLGGLGGLLGKAARRLVGRSSLALTLTP